MSWYFSSNVKTDTEEKISEAAAPAKPTFRSEQIRETVFSFIILSLDVVRNINLYKRGNCLHSIFLFKKNILHCEAEA